MTEDKDLLTQVVLLALLHKESGESISEVLEMLEEARAMTIKEGKDIISQLEKDGMIVNNELSFMGLAMAQKAQEEFKL